MALETIRLNDIDIQLSLDNNGNMYFEDKEKYQICINEKNNLYLDKGNYEIIEYNEQDDFDTFNVYLNEKEIDFILPSMNNGSISALYNMIYYKDNVKYLSTSTRELYPVLLTIEIYKSENGTFIYSKEYGSTNLIKYNLIMENNELKLQKQ